MLCYANPNLQPITNFRVQCRAPHRSSGRYVKVDCLSVTFLGGGRGAVPHLEFDRKWVSRIPPLAQTHSASTYENLAKSVNQFTKRIFHGVIFFGSSTQSWVDKNTSLGRTYEDIHRSSQIRLVFLWYPFETISPQRRLGGRKTSPNFARFPPFVYELGEQ